MATGTRGPVCLLCFLILCLPKLTFAAVFTPPYFNLAQGRNITATATCGYGVPYRELYCSIASNAGQSRNREPITGELIQGQYCDYCDSNNPDKDHRVENAIDGSERWWQSPPLSRLGAELNKVNVTINLGQEFHVAYVYIMMANSPRPGVWVLERSKDFGKTWQPWQYFADTPSDCLNFFNTSADEPLTRDTQIRCTTEFSKIVPLSNGEIVVSLVNGRPNAHNFSYADDLQEWTRATDIQLRLLRTKTLHAHLMAKVREDPTVTRRYYYSIKDISIGGRCVCNGHAVSCDVRDPDTNRLLCGCIHNTCGAQCDRCCPGFTQKKWRRALVDQPFQCEPCECFGHTAECIYDENVDRKRQSLDIYGKYEGGGVCQNCRDNTMGVNCEKCVPGYFRPYDVPRNATDACRPCECDLKVSTGECEEGSGRCLCRPEYTGELCDRCSFGYYGYPDCIPCECDVKGTEGSICTTNSGICPCKYNFAGSKCNQCAQGYYNFPECKPCGCNLVGSPSSVCDLESGQCQCLGNFAGRDCSECANGYFHFPTCEYCDCDHSGTTSDICDKSSGQCLCRERYTDERCNRCAPGFYRFPECLACQCESPGSKSKICFDTSGQCHCNHNFAGLNCDRCAAGYYKYPECIPCNCNLYGSLGQTCDQTSGQCNCRSNFVGVMCDKCGENFYNYPNCEVCNCNPDGAKEILGFPLGGCGIRTSGLLCECKDKVMGRICDKCKPGYWNLNRKNPEGCETCSCHEPGTLAGVNKCDMKTGQCECKPRVTGRDCNTCLDGFYNLQERNPFGCVDCECDRGGSLRSTCDKVTGKCACKPRITGQKCDKAVTGHYVPTLQQYKFEVEDGKTPEGARIRYGYDLREFPNFSWRGYAVLTSVQPEVRFDVDIRHSSLYQVIYRYVNPTNSTVKGTVTFTPDSPTENVQTGLISLSPTLDPKFVTVTSETSQSFVLNPGLWTISTNTPGYVFLDYFVLVPNAYYEASQVQHKVTNPCVAPNDPGPCVHFKYPDLEGHPKGLGKNGYKVLDDNTRVDVVLYPDDTLNNLLGSQGLVEINERQRSFIMDLYVPLPNEYLIFINYHNPGSSSQQLDVEVELPGGNKKSVVTLANCPFTTLCRQVLREPEGWEALFNLTTGRAALYINSRGDGKDVDLYIDSVYAIPKAQYHHDLIMPKTICVEVNGNCVPSVYGTPVGAQRIDFENTPNEDLVSKSSPPDILDANIGLVNLEDTIKLVDQTSCPISEDNKTDQCETETVTSVRPLELYGQVPKPGQYVFIVHYYMPKEAGLAIPVSVFADGVESTGIFSPRFCPNIVGCRATIRFDISGGNVVRLTGTDIKAVFNGTRVGQIWLDYMLIVPVDQYNPDFLDVLPVDKSAEFLKKCVDDGFQLKEGDKFCQEGAFTLTTNFNNGALDCNCNSEGSRSFTCDTFGGFCQCKDNIIGRTCSACRPGYYGFPNCRPCNCPFGVCQADTGECVCPPFVEGQSCDRCKPEAYGYDRLIGCQQCSCHPEGVLSRDLNCDQVTGLCRCKPHVGGRRCNTCMAGFYSFPHCEDCGCDVRGTLPGICDLRTSQCFCKENVEGAQCGKCIDGTFSLSSEHPKGCTKCFCFGHTTRCESTTLSWYGITSMSGWKLSNNKNVDVEPDTISVRNVKDGIDDGESVYWVAPADYLGKKINSYGGKLQYSVYNDVSEGRQVYALGHPDVIITGNNMTIVHTLKTQPVPKVKTEVELQLVQYNFQHEGTQNRVSREQFMMILINIESILIRATYYSDVDLASLSNVRMEIATVNGFGEVAKTVEECNCPPNYRGASCEDCAPGYYRARTTPYLGICLKCNCNGHSDSCDVVTGECYNCQNNTTGPHCEKCIAGYFGDPETGPCRICPCPLEIPSNNFASTCYYNESQGTLQCSCFPGYSGSRCQSCDSGYYGNPRKIGGFCQPCNCSGNIDMTNPDSCDRFTGDCLICERHTAGSRCEYCQDWYWGDAITQKNCQQCSCNRCGSVSCYKENGFCQCKPNVVGQDCDRCAQNTWGFDFCSGGCRDCECGAGAVTQQCDLNTGICLCQPGVEGEKCDRCKHGHWNLGASGCEACQCEFDGATGCDPDTGRCMCLPGVTGERCDRCLPRWILVPNRGCQDCDYCVHLLMDDLDTLYMNVNVVRRQLHEVSVGVGAFNRLSNYKDQASGLRPLVEQLNTQKSDDFGGKLKSLKELLDNHSIEVRKYHIQSVGVSSNAANIETQIFELNAKTNDATDAAKNVTLLGQETLQFIQLVDQKLMDSSDSVIIDALLTESNTIAQEIENLDFSVRKLNSNEEKENATEDVSRALLLRESSMKNFNYSNQLIQDIAKLESRLNDLLNYTQGSTESTEAAQGIIRRLQAVHVENLMMSHQIMNSLSKEREILIEDSEKIKSLGSESYNKSQADIETIEVDSSRLEDAIPKLQAKIDELDANSEELVKLYNQSRIRADYLQMLAADLDSMYDDTRNISQNSVIAGQSYKVISSSIDEANQSTEQVLSDLENTKNELTALETGAAEAIRKSDVQDTEARSLDRDTKSKYVDQLSNAENNIKEAEEDLEKVSISLETVNSNIDRLKETKVSEISKRVVDGVANANEAVTLALDQSERARKESAENVDKMEYIVNNRHRATESVRDTENDVQSAENNLPMIISLLNNSSQRVNQLLPLGDGISESVGQLREKIARARDEANRLKLGLHFLGNTSLTLRNPAKLDDTGSYTRVSVYIKTSQPEALLVYVGDNLLMRSEDGRIKRQVADDIQKDYLALEIRDRKVVFTFNLGSGSAKLVSKTIVNNGKWHHIIAERIGKSGKLTIQSTGANGDDIVEGSSLGTSSVLELSTHKSIFLVGGVPEIAEVPLELTTEPFNGGMEDLKFDDEPVGLWNFVEAKNNKVGYPQRDFMQEIFTEGVYFNGQGYSALSRNDFQIRGERTQVSFQFKTYAADGLLFYIGLKDYFSLELAGGHLLFRFDLGKGAAVARSNDVYNNGSWTSVNLDRNSKVGVMSINNQVEEIRVESKGNLKTLEIGEDIYIGGVDNAVVPPREMTTTSFEGCLKDFTLGTLNVNPMKNKRSKGLIKGCVEKIARIVTFPASKSGYIALKPVSIGSMFDVTFKIKTKEINGLLLFASDLSQSNVFAVVMSEGQIKVVETANNEESQLASLPFTYNDGKWHYISIMKMGRELSMSIDDTNVVNYSTGPEQIDLDTAIYLGGLPSSVTATSVLVSDMPGFLGCIGDITINKKFQNLANLKESKGISLTDCPVERADLTPVRTCALPATRSDNRTIDSTAGTRYGLTISSRSEYLNLGLKLRLGPNTIIATFRTSAPDGVIFYTSDKKHVDHLTVFMLKGKVYFGFDFGSGPASMSSTETYNDNEWHIVKVVRRGKEGSMYIDGKLIIKGSSEKTLKTLNVIDPSFVGGLPENEIRNALRNLKNVSYTGFLGCIKDLILDNKPFPDPARKVNTTDCSSFDESGAFFGINGGYLIPADRFKVHINMDIQLEIRPRTQEGVLLSVHNKTDYVVLQMTGGDIVFTVDNGAGPITARYKASFKFYLCDGNWHSINAVKRGNNLTLTVDGKSIMQQGSKSTSVAADTNDPLYIGGLTDMSAKGVLATGNYSGCIRNVYINRQFYSLYVTANGDVRNDACPWD